MPQPLPNGWVSIPTAPLWRLLVLTRTSMSYILIAVLVVNVVVQTVAHLVRAELGLAALTISVLAVFGAALAGIRFLALRGGEVALNLDDGVVRIGRRTLRLEELADAQALTFTTRSGSTSYLRLGRSMSAAMLLCVRSDRHPVLDAQQRELVAEAIRRSGVFMPEGRQDPYDPAGRFGWMDHPNHLTRDDAIRYVLETPADGRPVRTPPPKKSIWIDGDD